MSNQTEWSQEFIDELEEAISLCASRLNISQGQKTDIESALSQLFQRDFLLGYATRKK
jgi:hypothetical protein